ncbi:MAG: hypothetical protein ACTSO7_09680 [Candidatus Heimdallarchaeota archaeon]
MATETNGYVSHTGMVLPLRLYQINGGTVGSVNTVLNKIKSAPVEFKERKYYEGFDEWQIHGGDTVSVDYTVGQSIKVQRMKDNNIVSEQVYSQGKCKFNIHTRDKYLECRGTSWVVKKGLSLLMNVLGIEFAGIRLDDSSMVNICKKAELIKTVKISEMDNPGLSQIQLSGNIMESAEWAVYRRQGEIKFIRGDIILPNKEVISAQITNNGSMLIYKTGKGIPAKNVMSAVDMIIDLSKE